MPSRCVSLVLALLLLNASVLVPAGGGRGAPDESVRLEKLRKKAGKFASKRRARARVKMKDGRVLKGRITEATEDYFVIVRSDTRTVVTVRYPEVEELKESRPSPIPMLVAMAGVFCLITIPLLVSGPT